MKAECFSKTLVTTQQITWCFNPLDHILKFLSLWKQRISHNFINLILINAEYAGDTNYSCMLLKGRIMFYM